MHVPVRKDHLMSQGQGPNRCARLQCPPGEQAVSCRPFVAFCRPEQPTVMFCPLRAGLSGGKNSSSSYYFVHKELRASP
eukprot:1158856-Pelagomonas_calceolata.AAC.2